MEQKRIKVRLTKNSPYSDYGYYKEGDIGYIDGYVNDNAVIILENGKFAKANLRWIEVVNEEDKNVNTELRESEDERIRKDIVTYLQQSANSATLRINAQKFNKWIAWLEKQGEQKQKDEQNTNIKWGFDTITGDMRFDNLTLEQAERLKNALFGEQKPADKVEPKFKVGDTIRPKGSLAEYTIESISGECYHGKGWGLHISCDDDYELVEQNPAWSEEDEKFFKTALWHISYSISNGKSTDFHCDTTEWLKSLKDRVQSQNTWKPSEEQMMYLSEAIDVVTRAEKFSIVTALKELREQLKKLRE